MKLNYFLLFFAICYMQIATAQTSLEVIFMRCNNNNGFTNWNYFKIYNETDTIKLNGMHYDSTFTLNVLSPGSYKFEYQTVLNLTITKIIKILENQKNILEICVDKLEFYGQQDSLIIDLLQNNESYNIHFQSDGCFHRTRNALQISKVNSEYYILSNGNQKKLSESQVKLLREFEIEIKCIPDQWCTTIDYYTLEYANKKYKYKDNTCEWNGFYYLLENLGVDEEKSKNR